MIAAGAAISAFGKGVTTLYSPASEYECLFG